MIGNRELYLMFCFFLGIYLGRRTSRIYYRPSLFSQYINDIVDDIHSCIRLFADDTSVYIIVDNPISAADDLNADLAKIHAWAVI